MNTRVAQLTPVGRGAVASLAVEGPMAVQCVATCFCPHGQSSWSDPIIGRICVGLWSLRLAGNPGLPAGEELVVCRVDESRVEIHCHGGQAAVESILTDLRALGCQPVTWTELVGPRGQLPSVDAARNALASAATERTALILLDQFAGALDRAMARIAQSLRTADWSSALSGVDELLSRSDCGLHLVIPWQVTLAGPPNVGKSSLINALVGYQRAVVFDMPGTTRDVVTVSTAFQGWPVELSDTAGIQPTDDPLESQGVQRAIHQLRQADLIVAVADARAPQPMAAIDESLFSEMRREPLVVFNKSDLVATVANGMDGSLSTSAVTGQGIDELIEAIGRRLVPKPPDPGMAVPWQEHQVDLLHRLQTALQTQAVDAARALLATWNAVA